MSGVLVLLLVAAVASAGWALWSADKAASERNRANLESQRATGLRLSAEAQGMLAGTRAGGAVPGLLKLLAAQRIAADTETEGAILSQLLALGDLERIIEVGAQVNAVAFSPDGSRLVSGSGDGSLRLWDARLLKPIGAPMNGHRDSVLGVAFSRDSTRVVSGSEDGTLRLWDANSGQPIGAPMTGHERGVRSVAFDSQGARIVSGSSDRTLRLWDATTGQAIGVPRRGHLGQVRSVAFSGDGRRIVSGSDDGTLRLWTVGQGPAAAVLPIAENKESVFSLAFDRGVMRIVSGSAGGILRWWEERTVQ